ncbi:hypothetical protein W02_06410 [Nitrospira sp. KM1]|uniref:tetratricopeptide repeat protein n=1 Tax=Nitrospira sp. KM1 TaxID=1936990 RepID=UPI0013A770A9|nr:tetratricopeptide repeat protein [Nitrospira sp. KM1]BCA53501.1 hypothetical protein W02_06410 [Nitrospira sp. KM1]
MTRTASLLLLLLCFGLPLSACQDRRADRAYQKGNYTKTAAELQSLASMGEARAQYDLALLYDKGLGVPQSDEQALLWYKRAAEQGEPHAQYNLALMYMNGQGVPVDLVQAYYWLSLSIALGNEHAAQARDYVEARMTTVQITEGQGLARHRLESGPAMPRKPQHLSP